MSRYNKYLLNAIGNAGNMFLSYFLFVFLEQSKYCENNMEALGEYF